MFNEEDWIEIAPGLRAMVLDISPEVAERLLAKNDAENRPVAWHRVHGYAGDMLGKRWKLTHQPICVTPEPDRKLIDGQHRLQAVLMSGETVSMLIIESGELTIHDPIDRGAIRSVAFVTGLDRNVVAACAALRALEHGSQTNATITPGETQELYEHHRPAFDVIQQNFAEKKGKWLAGGIYAAGVFAHPIDPAKTLQFLHQADAGEMIQRGDPAFTLREWVRRSKRVNSWMKAMATCNALRYHFAGQQLTTMHTGATGYRALCARRRALSVPYTPTVEQVEGLSISSGMQKNKQLEGES